MCVREPVSLHSRVSPSDLYPPKLLLLFSNLSPFTGIFYPHKCSVEGLRIAKDALKFNSPTLNNTQRHVPAL